jgi:hypothetical protein
LRKQKAKGKGQKSKGRHFLFSFDFPSVAQMTFRNLKNKMALLPNRLLPFAICLLPFALLEI